MPSRVDKLRGHAEHLLDGFLGLREKYAMLDRMLFDHELVKRWGSGPKGRGFKILRNALYLSCVQEIAKLSADTADRAPSVRNFVGALADPSLRTELRENYSVWHIGTLAEQDPEVASLLKEMELKKQEERRLRFDEHYAQLSQTWSSFSASSKLQSFVTIRDKLSAHTDVHFIDGKYVLLDVRTLGLKWGDIKYALDSLQQMVDLVNLLVRNASFAWDMLDEQLHEAAVGFWGQTQ